MTSAELSRQARQDDPRLQAKTGIILVVDDEPDIEKLVRQIFRAEVKSKTYKFFYAHNGIAAIERLREHPEIELVLSDINMPEMNGFELMDNLTKYFPLIKTIIITAYGDMKNIRAAMNRGAADFITKPFNYNDLKTTIDKVLIDVRHLRELEGALSERQDALDKLSRDNAKSAGRMEFATSVLHNIGNVLNSVRVSVNQLQDLISSSQVEGVSKVNDLLQSHKDNLAHFFTENKKGSLLPEYLLKLGDRLQHERRRLEDELEGIHKRIELMADIIEDQQANAVGSLGKHKPLDLNDLIKDTISLKKALLLRHDIDVEYDLDLLETISAQKTLVAHILINLIKNSLEAMTESEHKKIRIHTSRIDDMAYCAFSDTGEGIENIDRIFTHGYTTKVFGHGFGLSWCHKAMLEMGGQMKAKSDGIGKGAVFEMYFKLWESH